MSLLDSVSQALSRPWMGLYVRVLAVALAYGGIVHIANIAGFGEEPWLEGPLAWRLGDLAVTLGGVAISELPAGAPAKEVRAW